MFLRKLLFPIVITYLFTSALATGSRSPTGENPIVSATYDFAHLRTFNNSNGDTWCTAWADDGALYTTHCDGTGFGSVGGNFGIDRLDGKVVGLHDLSQISGTAINSMHDPNYPNWDYEEGGNINRLSWKTIGLTCINKVLYLFVSPNGANYYDWRQTAPSVSLIASTDHGRTWSNKPQLYARTNVLGFDSSLNGWQVNPSVTYRASGGKGYIAPNGGPYVDLSGSGSIQKHITRLTPNKDYRLIAYVHVGQTGDIVRVGVSNYNGTSPPVSQDIHYIAWGHEHVVDLYGPYLEVDIDFKTDSRGQARIYIEKTAGSGTDSAYFGALVSSMFPGPYFGAPTFVSYGQDGVASVDGADQYVYAISTNGYMSNGDYLTLGRVLKSQIGNLNGGDWQFYTGPSMNDANVGLNGANWTSDVESQRITRMLNQPGGRYSQADVHYIAPLGRYVLLSWGWLYDDGALADDNLGDPWELKWHPHFNREWTTYLSIYEAPYPWGPWTELSGSRVMSYEPKAFYNPHIIDKFTRIDGSNPKVVHTVVSVSGEWDPQLAPGNPYYKLILVPLTLTAPAR